MAKVRMVNTRFWSDGFVREHLNPLDRYLFLYFLTNEKTNICGVYELPLSTIASETGLDREMLVKMLKRLKGKIDYIDGWVVIRNFMKYQNADSPKIKAGIARSIKDIPLKIREFVDKSIGYTYPSHTVSIQPEEPKLELKPEPKLELKPEPERVSSAEPMVVPFDEFWSLYPKKVERKKSEMKWARLSYENQRAVIDDIPKRILGRQWQAGYIPNPMTYLNGERWNDEIEQNVPTSNHTPSLKAPDNKYTHL